MTITMLWSKQLLDIYRHENEDDDEEDDICSGSLVTVFSNLNA